MQDNIIVSEELNEEYLVEKSRMLMGLCNDPFNLLQLKLLDIYMSLINARNPDNCTIRISKRSVEDLLGYAESSRIRPDSLKKQILSMMAPVSIMHDNDAPGSWENIVLFSSAKCELDENGKWWIEMSCSAQAKKYFFNVDSIGYFKYRLKNIIPMRGKHSIYMYMYCLKHKYAASWIDDIDTLKKELNCNSYPEFRRFNQKILKPAVDEMNRCTDISVEYEIKYGSQKKVIGVAFKIVDIKKIEVTNDPPIVIDAENTTVTEIMDMLGLDVKPARCIFEKAQQNNLSENDILQRIHYIQKQKNINNLVGYAISLMDNDRWNDIQKSSNTNTAPVTQFNSYHNATDMKNIDELSKLMYMDGIRN